MFINIQAEDAMLIALDLDGTAWDHPDISSLYPPFKRVGPLAIADSRGVVVNLRPRLRYFLQWARGLATSSPLCLGMTSTWLTKRSELLS